MAVPASEAMYLVAKFMLLTLLLRVTPRCQVWGTECLMMLFIERKHKRERRFEEESGHLFFKFQVPTGLPSR